ncbi:hypothetical protein METBIDRAFT_106434 [Metschnikowia bicuspidata var. bicuspidata NRRL YB-4993]|uniref:Altered inheritance of mitochondria protein 24, mitochondrial n=1 Tax=Metschnikowia bicuspidata var. bicuspidata NRRL YB-4993 TaxID=869754 RepID=A0A1A0HHY9_9ASCO|nr:hypothetical protein METBIDRAFT_106434 [Metschnikowia bicuspidata var. bicuspidata NRRL YB-4993]OBA23497.1 hypothetical protein METBIDRAFT_106434 [Metschnikowia bicuspidata var. bicuspidata NRRL YB-4993]
MTSYAVLPARAAQPRFFWARGLSFNQAPKALGPVPVVFPGVNLLPALDAVEELPTLRSVDDVRLEALGSPPQALSVAAPPSLPVYIRRNTMMTLQANMDHVRFQSRLLAPLQRLMSGNFVLRYQEIVGTEPFSVLVLASSPSWFPSLFSRTTQKSFTNLALDGAADWALFKRDALQVYAGPSLEISMRRVPARISRRFSKHLKLRLREPTGLYRWYRPGYTFVHGRGALGLVGNGMVYSASVAEGELIAVSRAHLLGISVNGPHDLENCIVAHKNPVKMENVVLVPPPQAASLNTWRDVWTQLKYYYWRLFDLLRKFRGRSMQQAIGNQDFVKVVGPRTILLQSGVPQESFERKFDLPRLTPASHVQIVPEKLVENKPADYLNVVTIEPGKAPKIESTDDFKDGLRHKN